MSPHSSLSDDADHAALKVSRSRRLMPDVEDDDFIQEQVYVIYNNELTGAWRPTTSLREVTLDDVERWRSYLTPADQSTLTLLKEGAERDA